MKLSYIVILLVVFYSCTGKKVLVEKLKDKALIDNNLAIFDSIQKKQIIPDFQQIRVQGKVDIKFKDELPELNLNMYIEKDVKIWTNVSLLIFSARSLITPEKFQGYEKIKKTYIDTDYQYVNDLLGLDFIDFESTQKLLLGRLCFPFLYDDFEFKIENKDYVFNSKKPIEIGKNKEKKSYNRTIIFNSDFSIKSIAFNNVAKDEYIFIEYVNKIKNNSVELPNLVKILVKDSKNKDIILKYTNFDFEKMETPFKIPENYTERKF